MTHRKRPGGTGPWDVARLERPPRTWPAPDFNEDGVQSVFFEGQPWQGRPTRVFAWYAVPESTLGAAVPAMVLVHGGGGTAFAEWVRLWAGRGYAAIAMDTCGCVPRGSYSNWHPHEHGGPRGWGGFDQVDWPPEDQWPYHAVADVLLAHSLLRSMPGVDPNRIGLTGISWGGYLACIAAGLDHRFRMAAPVYGCGFLGEDSTWVPTFKAMGHEKAGRWLGLWDPSNYLPGIDMPNLWVTGTNDFAYPMGSLRKSYRLPRQTPSLCVRIRMPHGHGGPGENPEEIRALADHLFRGGRPPVRVGAPETDGPHVAVRFESETAVTGAELCFTCDEGPWPLRYWVSRPAELDAESGTCRARVPDRATAFFVNITDERGLVASSQHLEREDGRP